MADTGNASNEAKQKNVSKLGAGIKAEFCGLATRDGVQAFNVENLAGTLIHASIGAVLGAIGAFAVKPEWKKNHSLFMGKLLGKVMKTE